MKNYINKTQKPGVRLKVYVREDMIGGGKLELLKIVGETGSISSAAKIMKLDYKRAWFLLDTLQRCFKEPLFITHRGGGAASGTSLTELGKDIFMRYSSFLVPHSYKNYFSNLSENNRAKILDNSVIDLKSVN